MDPAPTPAWPIATRWAVLLVASALIAALLELIGLPAGLLLGPMIASIALAVSGRGIKVPLRPFQAAQALVGCLIANALNADIVHMALVHWPLFLGTTVTTLMASVLIGYVLARLEWLPGSVAVWGTMPGAASAMVLMSEDYGVDSRLVAVMAYSRVVCVAGIASVLAALVGAHGGTHTPSGGWFPPIDAVALGTTLAVVAVGAAAGVLLKLPAGPLVGAVALGAALNIAGLVHFALPGWLLAISYALVGWRIGSNFTRDLMATAARAMPRILLSIVLLIVFSGGLGLLLARIGHIDLISAYLATSPGGLDSVAIIATSTPVDVPYVMALQMLRFVVVLLAGPTIARAVARHHVSRAA